MANQGVVRNMPIAEEFLNDEGQCPTLGFSEFKGCGGGPNA